MDKEKTNKKEEIKKETSDKKQDEQKQGSDKKEDNKKKKFTIPMKFWSNDFDFFSELDEIKKMKGTDFNKVIVYLVMMFFKSFLELKEKVELKKINIDGEHLKTLRKMFLDFEGNKNESSNRWDKTTIENYAIKNFKKRINVNLYAEKDEDYFILQTIKELYKSILENDKVEIDKFISKSVYFFILEGMKEFYKLKLKTIENLNKEK